MTPEEQTLFDKMGRLLTGVANALKGDPVVEAHKAGYAGMMHSWHDLPALAQKVVDENKHYKAHMEDMHVRLNAVADKLEHALAGQTVGDGQN